MANLDIKTMVDQVDSRETQPRHTYVSLVSVNDVPRDTSDSDFKSLEYPSLQMVNVGGVNVDLRKIQTENPDNEFFTNGQYNGDVTTINPQGIREMSQRQAILKDFYQLWIYISNPVTRLRGYKSHVFLSTDGINDAYVADFGNLSEEEESTVKENGNKKEYKADGTTLLAGGEWGNVESQSKTSIWVPNDSKFLSQLKFRFAFLEGGEL